VTIAAGKLDANWCDCENVYALTRISRHFTVTPALVRSPRVAFQNSCSARL
jgi:hypothetical protein